jgi:hypothetical protein
MTRPRILVTCWRRTLPTFVGERTILDTLDPAYAGRVAGAGGLPLVLLAIVHGGRLAQQLSPGDGHRSLEGLAPEEILAARHRSDWDCVGVQWHPEKMAEPEQTGLFAQLVGVARERSAVANDGSAVARERTAMANDGSAVPSRVSA